MKSIFTEFTPLKDVLGNDALLVWGNVIGGVLVGVSFVIIGVACLYYASEGAVEPGAKMRKILNQMIGLFMTSCGFSRLVDAFCTWHNLAYLSILLKLLTGIISSIALYYLPGVIRVIRNSKTINEVSEELKQTKYKIEKLQESTDKLTGGKK